jgi:guanosine-3',5'-bis(diphosphate) 3'-pyrophosphohydrolase
VSTRALPPKALESRVVRDALACADAAHKGHKRKGDDTPYIDHPVEVAHMLFEAGYSDSVVAAALLHDVVEDSDVTIEQIEDRFGEEIAFLVGTMTADVTIADYDQLKNEHREEVRWVGPPATAIYAADKLANLRALRAAYEEQGEQLGKRFNAPLDTKLEHVRRDIEMLESVRPAPPFIDGLRGELQRLIHLRQVNL